MDHFLYKRAFTIVEVLVVVVTISILASIVLLTYAGSQERALSNQARSNAIAVQKTSEAFYEETGRFPGTIAEFSQYGTKVPSNVILLTNTTSLSSANAKTGIDYDVVGSLAAASGARIRYWDFIKSGGQGIATDVIYLGDATSSSTFVNLGP